MARKRAQCVPAGGLYCTAMDRSLAPLEAHAKGLSVMSTWRLKDMSRSWSYVVYRTSAKDKGVVLNLCPWCGIGLLPDAAGSRPLPTLKELDAMLAEYHGSHGKLPYVGDLAAIRRHAFEQGLKAPRPEAPR